MPPLSNLLPSRQLLRKGLLVLFAGTTLGLGAAYGLRKTVSQSPGVAPEPAQVLRLSDDELNIGVVYETGEYLHRIHVTNSGPAPISIRQFQRSCTCADVSPGENVTIRGGETSLFTLKLDLAIRPPKADLSRD